MYVISQFGGETWIFCVEKKEKWYEDKVDLSICNSVENDHTFGKNGTKLHGITIQIFSHIKIVFQKIKLVRMTCQRVQEKLLSIG